MKSSKSEFNIPCLRLLTMFIGLIFVHACVIIRAQIVCYISVSVLLNWPLNTLLSSSFQMVTFMALKQPLFLNWEYHLEKIIFELICPSF